MRRHWLKWIRIRRGEAFLWLLRLQGRVAKPLGLRNMFYRRLASLIRRTRLFDEPYYLDCNPDVADRDVDALYHYARYGDREGRLPMPLFDPDFYRSHAAGRNTRPNALIHYWYLGRHLRLSPSTWFDLEFYHQQNRDVARGGEDPLRHYVEHGGAEGRSPSRLFDAAQYLRLNPHVQQAQINPLIHYLKVGRLEGRLIVPIDVQLPDWDPGRVSASVDLPDIWDDVTPRAAVDDARVDVVIPVYRGRLETLRCIRSVLLASLRTPFELVVIIDASPDADLVSVLRRHAATGLFTLLENESNLGFVHTANRGMALHADRDVLLLNADTEVYGDWLDRLRDAADRSETTGTVTPLSNNATIASYPRFQYDNPYPLELSFAELDALAATANAGVEVEAPTGVGFCMYMKRRCIDDVGQFDADMFGRGYGEENDFCQRAITKGWRNIIVGDVFVYHLGSASFQGERGRQIAVAMRKIAQRHPRYHAAVKEFIERDPLAPVRASLDRARLRACARASNVLIVCHNRGGGAERHVREDTDRLRREGHGVFLLRPVPRHPHLVRISHPDNLQLPNLDAVELSNTDTLARALSSLRIGRIHCHGTVDLTGDAADELTRLSQAAGVPLSVDIHDYEVICPRLNLADLSGRYCGEPDEDGCNKCLVERGNRYQEADIRRWRQSRERMLRHADQVLVPDEDVRRRLMRYFDIGSISVTPHEHIVREELPRREIVVEQGEPLHIVCIGAISKTKGYDVLLACARDARQRRLPLRFSLLGYSVHDAALRQVGVEVSGRYLENEGPTRLQVMQPHVVWLPSLWPETYSYTLSMALQGGYPVFAFDIGAIASRLRALEMEANLVPLQLQSDPRQINQRFAGFLETARSGLGR